MAELRREDPPRVVSVLSSVLRRVAELNDLAMHGRLAAPRHRASAFHVPRIPGISVHSYLERIFRHADCSPTCYVVAYVYLDRFTQRQPPVFINSLNIHRLLLTSILTAVKFMERMKETTNSSKKNTHQTEVEHDRNSHVYQPAWEPNMVSNGPLENAAARNKVEETSHEFRTILRKVFEEVESKSREAEQAMHLDHIAFKLFREKYGLGDDRKYVGSVPGVEVGDEFHLRVELCIVGLHHQHLAGIDFVNQGEKNVAISIASSGRYSDVKGKSDILIYPGSGMPNKDQTLDHGNLALKNIMETKTPV
ncbi:hypothetical protein COCNU_10G003290 [Cocos nucifera]|uniref:YDG domain-containing protein n=1 Tax=Cocos nucifera TaxID=13894 RepID=A0A8K0N7I7_COCNU|nr:hypothetical protein COCNU_10G003290 [Cocos nucifera]